MADKTVGVKNNKAKSRRQTKNKAKYASQFATTEKNRLRKRLKHEKFVQKKASKRMSFSFNAII